MMITGIDEVTKRRINVIDLHEESFGLNNDVYTVEKEDQKTLKEIKHKLIDGGAGMSVYDSIQIQGRYNDTIATLVFRGNNSKTGMNVFITLTTIKNSSAYDLRLE